MTAGAMPGPLPLGNACITGLLVEALVVFMLFGEKQSLWLVKSFMLLIVNFPVFADLKKVAEIRQQVPIFKQKRSDLYAVEAKKP